LKISGKAEILSGKYPSQKRPAGVAQVIEYLPSKCEALISNPNTTQKKKKENIREKLYLTEHVKKFCHSFLTNAV
jgi:hypothetical protein